MADQQMTYLKFPRNFGEMYCGALGMSHYQRTVLYQHDNGINAENLSIHGTPMVISQLFECAHGALRYNYSHFPANCGIGIYSSLGITQLPQEYYDHGTPNERRKEMLHALYYEFVHFIRRYSDKDMILLSDKSEGSVTELVNASKGEIIPIGPQVKNMNSRNMIQLYQTTRILNDSVQYRKLRVVEVVVLPRTEPELHRGYFKMAEANAKQASLTNTRG